MWETDGQQSPEISSALSASFNRINFLIGERTH